MGAGGVPVLRHREGVGVTEADFKLHVARAIGEGRALWPPAHPQVGSQRRQDQRIAEWVYTRLREQQRIETARKRDRKGAK